VAIGTRRPLSRTYTYVKTALAAKVKVGMPLTAGTNLQNIRNSEKLNNQRATDVRENRI